jgi:hypothetical protein
MRQLLRRAWYLIRQRRFEADLREELEFHRVAPQQELEHSGTDPAEARARMGVVRLVLSRVAALVGSGIIAGSILSVWASRFVATLLYGLEPSDPATLFGAALILATVAGLAGCIPAWRASRIDPAMVLRNE